jgi:chromosome segregation ATPase
LWEEYHKVESDLTAVRIDASSAWQEYHKMKEELAVTKSKLGQLDNYINETLKPELADAKIKLKMAQSAWDELDKSHAERAKLHDELVIAEGQRDQAKMRAAALKTEEAFAHSVSEKAFNEMIALHAERDEWKMKYEAAVEHNRKLRAYNESLVPLIEAAQELENSYHDIYVVNKVRQASANIREPWEDTRARCS